MLEQHNVVRGQLRACLQEVMTASRQAAAAAAGLQDQALAQAVLQDLQRDRCVSLEKVAGALTHAGILSVRAGSSGVLIQA